MAVLTQNHISILKAMPEMLDSSIDIAESGIAMMEELECLQFSSILSDMVLPNWPVHRTASIYCLTQDGTVYLCT